MAAELMVAIDGTYETSFSPDHWVAQEDAALVAGAKIGDARAFELLVQRHERKLNSLAQRITRNREDAEDVVQQTFQNAFIHLKKFEGKSLFSTWLTRIAINEALMLLRRRRGTREVPIAESNTEAETALPLDIPDAAPNPEDSRHGPKSSKNLSSMRRADPESFSCEKTRLHGSPSAARKPFAKGFEEIDHEQPLDTRYF